MRTPVASPIASALAARSGCTRTGLPPNSSAKEAPSERSNYLTGRRLDQLERGLTDCDWSILGFVAELRLVTSRQLMRRFFAVREADPACARTGRAVLKRLADDRVLERLPRVIGGRRAGSDGYVYVVGLAGRRLLARRGFGLRRMQAPGDRYIAHTLAIADVVVSLHEADAAGRIELIEIQTEPRCHRSYVLGFGGSATLKPDLFVRLGVGAFEDRLFIEVDRATEGGGTIAAKAAAYRQHYRSGTEQNASGVYPGVLWLVPDGRRREHLREILEKTEAAPDGMHEVACQDDLVTHLTSEAAR